MDVDACRKARCPFTETVRDGHGGTSRHGASTVIGRVAWAPIFELPWLHRDGRLAGLRQPLEFASHARKVWAICPQHLFAFGPQGISAKHHELAKRVFRLAGLQAPGDQCL